MKKKANKSVLVAASNFLIDGFLSSSGISIVADVNLLASKGPLKIYEMNINVNNALLEPYLKRSFGIIAWGHKPSKIPLFSAENRVLERLDIVSRNAEVSSSVDLISATIKDLVSDYKRYSHTNHVSSYKGLCGEVLVDVDICWAKVKSIKIDKADRTRCILTISDDKKSKVAKK